MPAPRKEQFSGCLLGQCVGDALGFLVEGHPAQACARYVKEEIRTGRIPRRTRGPFEFGQYSDDSQLARELLQSYLACGEFQPADYAQRIACIFTESRIVGRGNATEAAAYRLAAGVPWDLAGTPSPSAGNGSAMRAGPIGLLFYDDPNALVAAAHNQSRITHQDPRCSAGAVAIAGAVALVLCGGGVDPVKFADQLAPLVASFDGQFAAFVEQLPALIAAGTVEAAEWAYQAGLAPSTSTAADAWSGISPFVVGSVLWSLYSFLRSPEDYMDATCTAIAVGGDVDTTAAMTGAISGAHLGLEAIPRHLAERLTDQGTWNLNELVALAESAFEMKCARS